MSDGPSVTGADEPAARASAEERVGAGYAALLTILQEHESTDPETVAIRADLARAVAEAGRLDEALYQVDELVKDAERTHGPDHEIARLARDAQEDVRRTAGFDPA